MPAKRQIASGDGNVIWRYLVVNSVYQLFGNEDPHLNTFKFKTDIHPTADSKVTVGVPCTKQNGNYRKPYPPALPKDDKKREISPSESAIKKKKKKSTASKDATAEEAAAAAAKDTSVWMDLKDKLAKFAKSEALEDKMDMTDEAETKIKKENDQEGLMQQTSNGKPKAKVHLD